MKKNILYLIVILAAAFALAGCSLAEDITPPPGTSTSPQNTQAPSTTELPFVAPDPANGASVYAEKCATCHGNSGKGDGSQAANLPNAVPPIGARKSAQAARPMDWYALVTNGAPEKSMPSFAASLDARQRWDVIAYVTTLGITRNEIVQGMDIYNRECVACHGNSGKGDGPQAPGLLVQDFTNPTFLVQRSDFDLWQVLAAGKGNMLSFASKLAPVDIAAVSTYVRLLSFNNGVKAVMLQATAIPSAATAEVTPSIATTLSTAPTQAATPITATGTITITGKVSVGAGVNLPADSQVTLIGYDQMTVVVTQKTLLNADGTFQFDGMQTSAARTYIASVTYNGAEFRSKAAHSTDVIDNKVDLPIAVFETTADTGAVVASRLHVIVDFTSPTMLQVAELFIMSNTGTTEISAAKAGEAVLSFELPAGATNLKFQDGVLGVRYIMTDKGFADTQSIQPGAAYQVLFAYDVPYSNKLVLDLKSPVAVNAAVVMVPSNGVKVKSVQLQNTGVRDVQGSSLQVFTGSNFKAGGVLDLTLSGKPRTASPLTSGTTTSLIIGGVALALVVLGLLLFLKERNKQRNEEDADAETQAASEAEGEGADELMDAIAALDDLHQSGELPEVAWRQRRAELKEKLKKALEQ